MSGRKLHELARGTLILQFPLACGLRPGRRRDVPMTDTICVCPAETTVAMAAGHVIDQAIALLRPPVRRPEAARHVTD